MTSKLDAVKACTEAFGQLETGLVNAKAQADILADLIEAAHASGVGSVGEYLQIRNEIEAARGKMAGALAQLIATHSRCTKIARRGGCDSVLPEGFAIMSGGR